MKQFLFLLIVLNINLSLCDGKNLRDSVIIKTPIYEVCYSEKLEQPLWIKYTVQCTSGTISRLGLDFYTCDSIKTSDDEDYISNIYDKGHLAPASDFNCTKEMLHQTFSYLNCALQNRYLNRGLWRVLEEYERELAKSGKVTVLIKVKFTKDSIKLPTGSTVPDGFTKIIYLGKGKKQLRYYFPNITPTRKKFSDYKI